MIYFDSAATTFQKPESVARAVQEAMATMSSPGRGGYSAASAAEETAFRCRSELAELFHAQSPEQVVFTMNATHGLNIAIKSLVPPGGRVVISGYEHNAVTRPLEALHARVTVADGPLFQEDAVAQAFEALITPQVDAVICCHVSNVFGFIQPVEQVAAICRARKVPLIVDASQSAGVLPLDMERLGADFIAMPGHKGLYGPQGTGVLICGKNAPIHPLLEGGTGSVSLQQKMPAFLPDALEAGTHNMPGIAGLLAGVQYVRTRGMKNILSHELHLTHLMTQGLKQYPQIRFFARPDLASQTGVLSFLIPDQDVEALGEMLAEKGIATRAGFHCAPLAHRSAGTLKSGTVRLSFSDFNEEKEIDAFLKILGAYLQG